MRRDGFFSAGFSASLHYRSGNPFYIKEKEGALCPGGAYFLKLSCLSHRYP